MNLARRQRAVLADTAASLSPDAPTLCTPWSARDLLAHLVVRERRPDAVVGVAVPALAGYTARVTSSVAGQDYPDLVRTFRAGPPRWSPTVLPRIDDLVNTAEFLVHHEDLRRAGGQARTADLDRDAEQAAWQSVKKLGRMLYRSAPVGVVLVAPGHGRALVRRPPGGARSVVVTGAPLELLLHAFGRTGVATVGIEGREEDVDALAAAKRSV